MTTVTRRAAGLVAWPVLLYASRAAPATAPVLSAADFDGLAFPDGWRAADLRVRDQVVHCGDHPAPDTVRVSVVLGGTLRRDLAVPLPPGDDPKRVLYLALKKTGVPRPAEPGWRVEATGAPLVADVRVLGNEPTPEGP